jgi:hypothetical protein
LTSRSISEVQFGGDLRVAGRIGLSGDLAEALGHGDVRCRAAEDDAIERVEGFETQFEVQTFPDGKDFGQAQVFIEKGRTTEIGQELSTCSIADRYGKGVDVQVAIGGGVEGAALVS